MTQTVPSKEPGALNLVWVELNREQQTGVIQLMAQLVFKLVVAQIENRCEEAHDEQDPD